MTEGNLLNHLAAEVADLGLPGITLCDVTMSLTATVSHENTVAADTRGRSVFKVILC